MAKTPDKDRTSTHSVTANMPPFGVFVRGQRLAQQLTLRQFAQRVGIAAS